MKSLPPPGRDGTGNSFPRRGALLGILAGASLAALPAAAAPQPDAHLLALGRQFSPLAAEANRLWQIAGRTGAQSDFDVADTMSVRAGRVAYRIAQHQAFSPAGLAVKVAVLGWFLVPSDQTFEEGLDEMLGTKGGNGVSSDIEMAYGILLDLHRMAVPAGVA